MASLERLVLCVVELCDGAGHDYVGDAVSASLSSPSRVRISSGVGACVSVLDMAYHFDADRSVGGGASLSSCTG